MLLFTMTVVTVVMVLLTLLSSLVPTLSLLALVCLMLSPWKLQWEARKAASLTAPELVTTTEKPSISSMEQSLVSTSLSTSFPGESIHVCGLGQTALACDRYSSSMTNFYSLMNQFRESQDEATFILNSMDLTDSLGPMRVADHCESLCDAKKLLRSMSVTLGSISRHYRSLITRNILITLM